jgi:hypothetical protein
MACSVAQAITAICDRVTSKGEVIDDSTPMRRRLLAARILVPLQILPPAAGASDQQSVDALRTELFRQWSLPASALRQNLASIYSVDANYYPTEVLAPRCADGSFSSSCPSGDDDSGSGGLSNGAKIAIAVCAVVGGGALVALFVWKCCWSSDSSRRPKEFSGVELQYDESVRPSHLLSSPAAHQTDSSAFDSPMIGGGAGGGSGRGARGGSYGGTAMASPAGHAPSGAPMFEEVQDDVELTEGMQGRSHRMSVI